MEEPKWGELENLFFNDNLPEDEHWRNNSVHIIDQMTFSESDVAKEIIVGSIKWKNLVVDQLTFDKNYRPDNIKMDLPFPNTLLDLMCMDFGVADAISILKKLGRNDCIKAVSKAMENKLQSLAKVAILENQLTSNNNEIVLLSSIDFSNVSIARQFTQQGFTVLRGVFSEKEITEFRTAAIEKLPINDFPFNEQFSSAIALDNPFDRIFTNKRVIDICKEIMGEDFIYFNQHVIHDSSRGGWHTDTGSPEFKGSHEFHWAPTFLAVQCVLYFQSNEEGSFGLDIIPRSHLIDDHTTDGHQQPAAYKKSHDERKEIQYHDLIQNQTGKMESLQLDTKAGDVVFFHVRLVHRASPIKFQLENNSERKFAAFAVAGANNLSSRRYKSWLDEYDIMNEVNRVEIPENYRRKLSSFGVELL